MAPGSGCLRIVFKLTFLALGPCLLAFSLVSAYQTKRFLRQSITSQAIIVQLKQVHSGRHAKTSYAPVFTFPAENGRAYTVTSRMSSNPPAFKVGQVATVHYAKDHPEQARLDSFLELWLFDIIGGVIGVIFSLLMIAVIFGRKGQPRIYSRSSFGPAFNRW
jgi:hypothetical protein